MLTFLCLQGYYKKYPNIYDGYDTWHKYVSSFGLGNWLMWLPTGKKGFYPPAIIMIKCIEKVAGKP